MNAEPCRDVAIQIVDLLAGYTIEFASDPAAHKRDYDVVEAILERNPAVSSRGDRLYSLLGLYDTRNGSIHASVVRAAREGYERSHPDMDEDTAWDDFERLWNRFLDDLEFSEQR